MERDLTRLFRTMNTESKGTQETVPCVLCAFNLGESADSVVKSAVAHSVRLNLPLMILCSYRLIQTNASEEVVAVKKRFERMAFKQIKSISTPDTGIQPSFRTEIGFLSDRVESFIKAGKVNLLVVGNSTAATIYEHKGLTLKEFVKKINVPVLVIPE